ncbi:hypothetical protein [Neopusillimonas aromaticivorans]|uniref:hypothetical protein n=1 Tax=Neopusillimonas aromaticivorans TaxID=2979868 RepID=UPI002596FC6E|nr:hypothetical protein [Neopusillimonas aromaticivorans]WJJ93422.1 hypothetical protein N7E01_15890 [Neopusillimonas aromaticivorans]
MIEWIAGITWRDVFFMFFGSALVWVVLGIARWLISDWVKSITSNPLRVVRYWLMVLSMAGALWLSERPELSSRETLYMIILSFVAYWSMTAQHQENIEEQRNSSAKSRADEDELKRSAINHQGANKRESSDG